MTYPPIDSHGFLSDTHTTALVGPDGGVDWMCVPRADGPSLFARILDREEGGTWRVAVRGGRVVDQQYEPGTFVLVTTWESDEGTAEVLDFLAVQPSDDPDDLEAGHLLVRLVRTTRGHVRVECEVDARPEYARERPRWRCVGPDVEGHDVWAEAISGVLLHTVLDGGSRAGALRVDGTRLHGTVELQEGEEVAWVLDHLPLEDGRREVKADEVGALLESTRRSWRAWGDRADYEGPAVDEVLRSALVLRALSFDETGALLAAATTSLPEAIGGERNYDYRFTWHRDASLHVMALYLLGHDGLGARYGRFLVEECVRAAGRLRPMAGLSGEQTGEEVELEHLRGYADSRPVRVGNEAFGQVQHSTDGFVLDATLAYHRLGNDIPPDHWRALRAVVDTAAQQWREPDANIWEMRGPPRHFTHSKVLNWVALDRGISLAESLGDAEAPVDRWRAERDAVRADVLERGWDEERRAFVQEYGEPHLDASLLRLSLLGFLPGDDPRVVSTIDRIADELGEGAALIRRYDTDEVDDGLRGGEGAFLLSSFEMVGALVLAGGTEQARRRFDWLVERAGPLGLYSEQMAPDGQALGNYPQAFTHLGLIEAAVLLQWADEPERLQAWVERRSEAFEATW